MSLFSEAELVHLVQAYGPWLIGLVIGLEALGIPLPAESALVATSVYAGTGGQIDIKAVAIAAMVGAIVGDNIGYAIGRILGEPALRRFGPRIGLDPGRQALARYLFRHHGGKVVLLGRFVAFLRTFAALLAGANRMKWDHFLLSNAAGGILWAGLYTAGGYMLGSDARRIAGVAGVVLGGLALVAVVAGIVLLRRKENELVAVAVSEEKALAREPAHAAVPPGLP